MSQKEYNGFVRTAPVAVFALLLLAGAVWHSFGYVWFGYNPASSAWLMTPTTIMLDTPQQTSQVQVLEYMADICTTSDITGSCTFWTDNPEWRMTSGGLLSCRVSGEGVCYARVPTGTVISNTISVDPHLPPRILRRPLLPPLPAPATNLIYFDTRNCFNPGWDDLTTFTRTEVATQNVGGTTLMVTNTYVDTEATLSNRLPNLSHRFLVAALQGLVNRTQPRIITFGGGTPIGITPDGWYSWITNSGFTVTQRIGDIRMVTNVLAQFLEEPGISGLVIYPTALFTNCVQADLLHWLTAGCAVSNWLPVTPEIYAMLPATVTNRWPVQLWLDNTWLGAHSITSAAAIYADAYTRWWPACRHDVVAHAHPWIRTENRDYWIAQRIWPFAWRSDASVGEDALFTHILSNALPIHAPILGLVGQFEYEIDRYCGAQFTVSNISSGSSRVHCLDGSELGLDDATPDASVAVILARRASPQPTGDWSLVAAGVGSYQLALQGTEAVVSTNYVCTGSSLRFRAFSEVDGNVEWAWWKLTSRLGKSLQYTSVPNWSFYAGLRWEDVRPQPLRNAAASANALPTNAIMCCGFMADGDNTMFDTWFWPDYWQRPAANRGAFSYGINPLMYDVAPLQMRWFHAHETGERRLDAESGAGIIWAADYGAAFGKPAALLRDFLLLSDQYLALSGLRVVRPQFEATRALYQDYAQLQYADSLGGSYGVAEPFCGNRPTNINGKVWLLNEDRMRLADAWRQQFLIASQDALTPRPQYHAVWCYNQFTPDKWTQWIDVQTNPPPDWRNDMPFAIIPPECMVEVLQ